MGGVCIPIKLDLLLAKLEGRQIDGHNHSATWCFRKVDCMAKSRFYQCRNRFYQCKKKRFDYCEIKTWKSIQIWRLNLENTISLGVLWENDEQFFK